MTTQTWALLIVAVGMLLVLSIYLFAFVYDYLVPKKLKETWFRKFNDWWESLAWNSGQW